MNPDDLNWLTSPRSFDPSATRRKQVFGMVTNPEEWTGPIDCQVPQTRATRQEICDAVRYYLQGEPTIDDCTVAEVYPDGTTRAVPGFHVVHPGRSVMEDEDDD